MSANKALSDRPSLNAASLRSCVDLHEGFMGVKRNIAVI